MYLFLLWPPKLTNRLIFLPKKKEEENKCNFTVPKDDDRHTHENQYINQNLKYYQWNFHDFDKFSPVIFFRVTSIYYLNFLTNGDTEFMNFHRHDIVN